MVIFCHHFAMRENVVSLEPLHAADPGLFSTAESSPSVKCCASWCSYFFAAPGRISVKSSYDLYPQRHCHRMRTLFGFKRGSKNFNTIPEVIHGITLSDGEFIGVGFSKSLGRLCVSYEGIT